MFRHHLRLVTDLRFDLGGGAMTNPEKDPEDWVTGDEPMTGPQESYLHTLAQEAGVAVPDNLTKVEASRMIDELQEKTGRGTERRR
jgi:hypothetical protein